MKRFLLASLGLAVLLTTTLPLQAQRSGRGKAEVTLNGKTVSIDYGRPSLHGRTISQMLAMPSATGDFWRLGANQSTTFTTEVALAFGNVAVPAGTYSLWAEHSGNDQWQLVFNTQHGQWGTSHNPKLDIAKVPLHEEKVNDSADVVTIKLANEGDGARFSVQWGDLLLATNFTAQ
jgi:Protein of unknown function (DUF2911)